MVALSAKASDMLSKRCILLQNVKLGIYGRDFTSSDCFTIASRLIHMHS